ncbi:hypothetical protein PRIPAC_77965, partial [Pristionchus pacificus]
MSHDAIKKITIEQEIGVFQRLNKATGFEEYDGHTLISFAVIMVGFGLSASSMELYGVEREEGTTTDALQGTSDSRYALGPFGNILIMLSGVFPSIDAIMIILFIPAYKNSVTAFFLKKMKPADMIQSYYRSQIEVAQKERDESIEWARKETALVNDVERRTIEAMDFKQLRESLQSGKVSAESVVRVYYGSALKAHEKTNCLTGIIKEALYVARELDTKAMDPSYKKPRMFGIPISVKESIELEGRRNTWALAKFVEAIPREDSYQVMVLRKDGAIPFCQTNIPTTCISYTCANSVYGTSTNPHSSSRTCGGSSGGEGALIASGGSLIGLGSDLGGSIRVPAAFSGCCGFKPSASRCSTLQLPEPIAMRPMLMVTEGPLARDPHAIVQVMRSMWSDQFMSSKDPFSAPVDFREDLFEEGRKYRIGYYTSDGYIDPLPGNQRVVREAVELLRAKGHKRRPFIRRTLGKRGREKRMISLHRVSRHDLFPFSLGDIAQETSRGVYATLYAD